MNITYAQDIKCTPHSRTYTHTSTTFTAISLNLTFTFINEDRMKYLELLPFFLVFLFFNLSFLKSQATLFRRNNFLAFIYFFFFIIFLPCNLFMLLCSPKFCITFDYLCFELGFISPIHLHLNR